MKYHGAFIENTCCHYPPSIVNQFIRICDHLRSSPIGNVWKFTIFHWNIKDKNRLSMVAITKSISDNRFDDFAKKSIKLPIYWNLSTFLLFFLGNFLIFSISQLMVNALLAPLNFKFFRFTLLLGRFDLCYCKADSNPGQKAWVQAWLSLGQVFPC